MASLTDSNSNTLCLYLSKPIFPAIAPSALWGSFGAVELKVSPVILIVIAEQTLDENSRGVKRGQDGHDSDVSTRMASSISSGDGGWHAVGRIGLAARAII